MHTYLPKIVRIEDKFKILPTLAVMTNNKQNELLRKMLFYNDLYILYTQLNFDLNRRASGPIGGHQCITARCHKLV